MLNLFVCVVCVFRTSAGVLNNVVFNNASQFRSRMHRDPHGREMIGGIKAAGVLPILLDWLRITIGKQSVYFQESDFINVEDQIQLLLANTSRNPADSGVNSKLCSLVLDMLNVIAVVDLDFFQTPQLNGNMFLVCISETIQEILFDMENYRKKVVAKSTSISSLPSDSQLNLDNCMCKAISLLNYFALSQGKKKTEIPVGIVQALCKLPIRYFADDG